MPRPLQWVLSQPHHRLDAGALGHRTCSAHDGSVTITVTTMADNDDNRRSRPLTMLEDQPRRLTMSLRASHVNARESATHKTRARTSHPQPRWAPYPGQPDLPTITAMFPFLHDPNPTVCPLPLELRQLDTSVPGLMQDVGSLHVANLVAGDILTSGDESSRPPTALDDVGTPRESNLMLRPRYLSLNGSGLDVPWIQTPSAEPEPKPTPEPATQPEPRTQRPSVASPFFSFVGFSRLSDNQQAWRGNIHVGTP
jgi:hypothetical protein